MASKRFSALPAASEVADSDLLVMTDVSDLSDGANGTTKKVSAGTLRSSFGSDVGWLEVRPSLDPDDWSLDEDVTFEDGILVSVSGGYGGSTQVLTGDGVTLWNGQACPLLAEAVYKVRYTNWSIDSDQAEQLNPYWARNGRTATSGGFIFEPETPSGYKVRWAYSPSSDGVGRWTFPTLPTDWFTLTIRQYVIDGFTTNGLGATGTDTPSEFYVVSSGTTPQDLFEVDMNETVLRIKPW